MGCIKSLTWNCGINWYTAYSIRQFYSSPFGVHRIPVWQKSGLFQGPNTTKTSNLNISILAMFWMIYPIWSVFSFERVICYRGFLLVCQYASHILPRWGGLLEVANSSNLDQNIWNFHEKGGSLNMKRLLKGINKKNNGPSGKLT